MAHVSNSPCQYTAKRSCQTCAAEEEGDAVLALVSLIPHAQVINNAREKPRLCYTKAAHRQSVSVRIFLGTHKKRTTKKPARFWVTPIKVATIPQAIVNVGNQNFGVVRFRMMLHGSSKRT
jgi:hypothetical protein